MKSEVNMKEKSLAEIVFDVPPEEFKKALEKAFRKNSKKFSIPGFRPGKAPMNIVTKYYGEGVLYDDAVEDIAQSAYTKAIEEHSLDVVSKPEIDEISEIGSEKGIKFTIKVTVKPEVQLGEYKGVKVEKEELKISREDIEKELDGVRERNSRMVPADDREAREGDTANIDYEGFLDGESFEGGKGQGYDLRIGSNSFIPGFEDQVKGKKAGDEFEVNVTFPEDYHAENLKGKDVVFNVKLNSIKVKELPEADDEFAKDVSEFDTLEEYKKSLEEKLEKRERERIEKEFEENVIKKVVEGSSVEIPDTMIENEADRMVQEQATRMKQQGIELEQFLQYTGQKMEDFKQQMRESAQDSVKTKLVIEAIEKELDFEITQEEIDEQIEKMAEQYNMKVEEVKKQIPEDADFIKDSIKTTKTVEYLKNEAESVAKGKKKTSKTPKKKTEKKGEKKNENPEKESAKEK